MNKPLLLLALCLMVSCKAQIPIVALDPPANTVDGVYYKDLDKELDKFVGTWKYQTGNKIFKIVIRKKVREFVAPDYLDALVGEYQYMVDNIEMVNTLGNVGEENMFGNFIIKPHQRPRCITCSSNERRIELYFNDPERAYLSNSIVLRYIPGSLPSQLTAVIYSNDSVISDFIDGSTTPRVPYGEYLMTKQ